MGAGARRIARRAHPLAGDCGARTRWNAVRQRPGYGGRVVVRDGYSDPGGSAGEASWEADLEVALRLGAAPAVRPSIPHGRQGRTLRDICEMTGHALTAETVVRCRRVPVGALRFTRRTVVPLALSPAVSSGDVQQMVRALVRPW